MGKRYGRNKLCYCKSGIKYKYCHMALDLKKSTLPKNNIYNMNENRLNFLNTTFYEIAKSDIPLFEFCLEHNIYYFKSHSIQSDINIKKSFANQSLTIEQLFENWVIFNRREYYDRMMKNSIHVNSCLSKKELNINQILDAHFQEMYTISIPSSFSVIEGLFRDYHQVSFSEHQKVIYKIKEEAYQDTMLYSDFEAIKYFSKFLNKLMSGNSDENTFHRNSILHGINNNYATENNSLLLILTIFEFFNLESKNKYWPPNVTNKDGLTYINNYKVEMKNN